MIEVELRRHGDSLLLGGYVEDKARRLALQRDLDGSGVGYRLEALSVEDMRQGGDFILQKLGYRRSRISYADKRGLRRPHGAMVGP
ncbi:EscD/YscD/HrpQ family type III secretion system periplasmic domain-containing protein, partial [Pseudomonas aeruginosa]